jgi:hypothetical protein
MLRLIRFFLGEVKMDCESTIEPTPDFLLVHSSGIHTTLWRLLWVCRILGLTGPFVVFHCQTA